MLPEETKTAGGILIPDNAKRKAWVETTVVAVGNGKVLAGRSFGKIDNKVGDRVLFSKYSGTEIKDSEEHLILREDDVLGVIG